MSDKYKAVPISAAKQISKLYEKDQVIVICWDSAHGLTHITTYGKDKVNCQQAAHGGDVIRKALGLTDIQKGETRNQE